MSKVYLWQNYTYYFQERKVWRMNEPERKIRTCLFCILIAALVIGVIYFFTEVENAKNIEKGVLITGQGVRIEKIWKK